MAENWLTGKNNELAVDPVQFQMLEEVLRQCEVFASCARKIGNEEIAIIYDNTASAIKKILEQKEMGGLKDQHQRDTVFHAMIADLNAFDQL